MKHAFRIKDGRHAEHIATNEDNKHYRYCAGFFLALAMKFLLKSMTEQSYSSKLRVLAHACAVSALSISIGSKSLNLRKKEGVKFNDIFL